MPAPRTGYDIRGARDICLRRGLPGFFRTAATPCLKHPLPSASTVSVSVCAGQGRGFARGPAGHRAHGHSRPQDVSERILFLIKIVSKAVLSLALRRKKSKIAKGVSLAAWLLRTGSYI